jgi:DnaJ-class molecular chaperone
MISPARAERHRELDRVGHVAANADVAVVALELDALETGATQHVTHHVRPRHRERPRTTVHLAISSCDTTGTISFTRSSASCSHGFSSRRRQTICVNVPPGLSDLHMLRIAAPGVSKNMLSNRANA